MTDLPKFGLGYSGTELCTQLVQAVLRGEKTATAGLAEEEESPPRAGDRYLLHDAGEQAVGIIEVTEARIVPAGEIDLDFARDEGEGFESVEEWRLAHERFFDRPITDGTLVVAVRFRLAERF